MPRPSRQSRRAIDATQPRWRRILAKVQRLGYIDSQAVKTPEELIEAMQKEAERLHREGSLRDDELRDLKALHTIQREQLAAAAAQRQKARDEHAKRMKAARVRAGV